MEEEKTHILAGRLNARRVVKHGIYLGIPCTVGRSKSEIFQMVVDRVRKKRSLSLAGRVVLIKAIAQAIPTYLMSCFLLPEKVCDQLNSLVANFFWGQKADEKRIHWRSWKVLCKAKVGFRDIHSFNKAMLAKQSWRLLMCENSLLSRCLRSRYYPRIPLLTAVIAHNPSYTWRSIIAGNEVIRSGTIWRVGDGQSINVWSDKWIPNNPGGLILNRRGMNNPQLRVSDLMESGGERWNKQMLDQCCCESDINQILAIPINYFTGRDKLIWKHEKNGIYSVRSGYLVAKLMREATTMGGSSSSTSQELWNWIWGLQVPQKIKIFMWRCATYSLPVMSALTKRNCGGDHLCRRCGREVETLEHCLRDCPWSSFYWKVSPLRIQDGPHSSIMNWFTNISQVGGVESHALFATLLWSSWKQRNSLIFQNKDMSQRDCIEQATRWCVEFLKANEKIKKDDIETATIQRWVKPAAGWWKINSDASVKAGHGTGLGAVVRNEKGDVLITATRKLEGCYEVEIAEGLACLLGVEIASSLCGKSIEVEVDCQILHKALVISGESLSYLGEIVKSIKGKAASLDQVLYSWSRRTANQVAHHLASLALLNSNFCCYTGPAPVCCSVLVTDDSVSPLI